LQLGEILKIVAICLDFLAYEDQLRQTNEYQNVLFQKVGPSFSVRKFALVQCEVQV